MLFLFHGLDKLMNKGLMAGEASWMTQMGLACGIEIICGVMIIIGFYTSIAAFLSSGLMAGAYC